MKFFKRWRHARSLKAKANANAVEAEPVVAERAPVHPTPPKSTPRGRRASTMGKTIAEQAYLAEAAQRAKQDR